MVTRALGAGPESDPDYWLIPAEVGDRMLICSDGLTGEVDDAAIERLLRRPTDVRTIAEDLVGRALDGGGHDNISVVIVEAVEVVGQSLATEDTAGASSPVEDEDGFEVDEDTLPRHLSDGEDRDR
jgi:protein phosphatase